MSTDDATDTKSDGQPIDYTDPETLRRLYWDEGYNTTEIAEMADCGSTTVLYHMDKHGIERRDRRYANRVERATYTTDSHGYPTWICSWGEKQESVKVHRLLAVSEYGFDEVKDKHVHHRISIPWLNTPENIEAMEPYDHHSEHFSGESHHKSKLSNGDVKTIKNTLKFTDLSYNRISERFGVSGSTISKIDKGESWDHIPDV